MKKILLITILAISALHCAAKTQLNTATASAVERERMTDVLRELQYLQEYVLQMKKQYSNTNSKIRFNYDALLAQLKVTENNIREYVNLQIDSIHIEQPKVMDQELFEVRRN